MKNKKLICSVLLAASFLGGCTATGGLNSKTTGTAGGAALGAIAGQVIGQNTKGTLIGAAVGGLAGLGWGAYKDQQTKELQASLQNSQVQVTDQGNYINLNLPGGVTFATNSATINKNFYPSLDNIATVLNRYPDTRIVVSGYTDNTGAYDYNVNLSQKRARSVADYLVSRGVNPYRLTINGYGPAQPIANNATQAGRAQNRRVEIQIYPAQ